MMKLHVHSPIRLHGVVLNSLSIAVTLLHLYIFIGLRIQDPHDMSEMI
jgi:hypothetical protein